MAHSQNGFGLLPPPPNIATTPAGQKGHVYNIVHLQLCNISCCWTCVQSVNCLIARISNAN